MCKDTKHEITLLMMRGTPNMVYWLELKQQPVAACERRSEILGQ